MNKLPIMIKREFWEHRGSFVILPLVVMGFVVLVQTFVFTGLVDASIAWGDEEVSEFFEDREVGGDLINLGMTALAQQTENERKEILVAGLLGLGSPLGIVLWFVTFFYLLGSLFDDRRDRSVLFWKSMPVSDTTTVLSKLLTALVVVPLGYLLCAAVLHLVALAFLTFGALSSDLPLWATLWGPGNPVRVWGYLVATIAFYALWALPFYAWLMLVSSYVKSLPLAWAVGVPFGLAILEAMFTSQSRLGDWMINHILPFRFLEENGGTMLSHFLSLNMLSAVVVGVAFLVCAIWLRGRTNEI